MCVCVGLRLGAHSAVLSLGLLPSSLQKLVEATAPFQFALQTRAGADALTHAVQALCDSDPGMVLVSLDGVGAFDHVRRAAMFKRLLEVPAAHSLIPLVRMFYSSRSVFL